MAYVKTVWQTGDTITAAKLNNAEDGIEAASALLLPIDTEYSDGTTTLKKTYKEIYDACAAGALAWVYYDEEGSVFIARVIQVYVNSEQYIVKTDDETSYVTDSETGYPSFTV